MKCMEKDGITVRQLDQIDIEILAILEENARISVKELSRRLGYPDSTIRDRIHSLEEDGIILGYHTLLNHEKLGLELKVVINLTQTKFTKFERLAEELEKIREVTNVQFGTGEVDETITLYARDVNHLKETLYSIFGEVEWPTHTSTGIVLHERNFPLMRSFTVAPAVSNQKKV
jgi:DNA-binding Lrp family transcriptional regulator